jgi:hypothetical protein
MHDEELRRRSKKCQVWASVLVICEVVNIDRGCSCWQWRRDVLVAYNATRGVVWVAVIGFRFTEKDCGRLWSVQSGEVWHLVTRMIQEEVVDRERERESED